MKKGTRMHAKRERHSAHCRRIPESCTKQTPSFLRLLELFEVLLVEEEAAILHELLEELLLHDGDKANMIENFTRCFFAVFAKKKNIQNTKFII